MLHSNFIFSSLRFSLKKASLVALLLISLFSLFAEGKVYPKQVFIDRYIVEAINNGGLTEYYTKNDLSWLKSSLSQNDITQVYNMIPSYSDVATITNYIYPMVSVIMVDAIASFSSDVDEFIVSDFKDMYQSKQIQVAWKILKAADSNLFELAMSQPVYSRLTPEQQDKLLNISSIGDSRIPQLLKEFIPELTEQDLMNYQLNVNAIRFTASYVWQCLFGHKPDDSNAYIMETLIGEFKLLADKVDFLNRNYPNQYFKIDMSKRFRTDINSIAGSIVLKPIIDPDFKF